MLGSVVLAELPPPPPHAAISAAATPTGSVRVKCRTMMERSFVDSYSEQQRSIAARVDKESRR
jgi:hypothetical protein